MQSYGWLYVSLWCHVCADRQLWWDVRRTWRSLEQGRGTKPVYVTKLKSCEGTFTHRANRWVCLSLPSMYKSPAGHVDLIWFDFGLYTELVHLLFGVCNLLFIYGWVVNCCGSIRSAHCKISTRGYRNITQAFSSTIVRCKQRPVTQRRQSLELRKKRLLLWRIWAPFAAPQLL